MTDGGEQQGEQQPHNGNRKCAEKHQLLPRAAEDDDAAASLWRRVIRNAGTHVNETRQRRDISDFQNRSGKSGTGSSPLKERF